MTQARWFIVVLLGLILGETNLNDKYWGLATLGELNIYEFSYF
jgi:hypothetical protein